MLELRGGPNCAGTQSGIAFGVTLARAVGLVS